MALTVNSAFTEFNRDFVNLDPERTKKARGSRDWLIDQLKGFPNKDDSFPGLYDERHVKFGSFARNTKIRELDDIDLILAFSADYTTYSTIMYGKYYTLNVPVTAVNLRKLCNDNGTLNSIKLINKLIGALEDIDQYKSAQKHRNQEAATLQLKSYEWNFDIIPAFYTDTGYYLIPDGNGNWKATDPRIDQDKVTTVNQKHEGKIAQIIRTLKYWNRRASMPTISSYLFENIVLNFFDSRSEISTFFDFNLRDFWGHLKYVIYYSIPDPKGFQDELNSLSQEDKDKISRKADDTYKKANDAINYEVNEKDTRKSINKWREIFGDKFPDYG